MTKADVIHNCVLHECVLHDCVPHDCMHLAEKPYLVNADSGHAA